MEEKKEEIACLYKILESVAIYILNEWERGMDGMLELLIIGSGPAGLSAAIYAKRAGLSVLVAEKVYHGTGQIVESSQVDNYLGLPEFNGYHLGEKFREHAVSMEISFQEGEADAFAACDDHWNVHFKSGEEIEARAVLYAAGAVHRHLEVPGEQEFTGKGVSYCATCDGAFYRNKDAAVVGGGNTAMDDALYLSNFCKKVYLIHRRDRFRGSRATLDKIQERDNIELVTKAQVVEIQGTDKVTALRLEDGRKLEVSGVFIAVGMVPPTDMLQGVVELDEYGYIIADESGISSAPGFFAAGDVRTKELRQVVTAVSDGANAAMSAEKYLLR